MNNFIEFYLHELKTALGIMFIDFTAIASLRRDGPTPTLRLHRYDGELGLIESVLVL